MATTTFAAGTVIASTWLNDVNDVVYGETQHVAPQNSVAIPSYSFAGNLTNGWWAPNPGEQGWTLDGANTAMRLTSTGLGIGVTPSGAGLHVKSASVNVIKAETTTARGSGSVVVSLIDPTGTKGYYGYGAANDVMHVYQGLNAATNFYTNAAHHATLSATGDFTLRTAGAKLGYDTGAGGTVTQATSKSTAVTLNTTNGQVVMHNASLASGATVGFALNNTTIAATDVVLLSYSAAGASSDYNVWVYRTTAGQALIAVKNVGVGALAEVVTINFAVIKAVTS